MQEKLGKIGSDGDVALVNLKRLNDSETIHEENVGEVKDKNVGEVKEEVKERVMFTPDDIERIIKSLDTKSASGYYYYIIITIIIIIV